jgi:DNA-binding PadR family transcriptional regulator
MPTYLGEFEQLVLLAIVRLGPRATGAAIREVVEEGRGRTVWIGAVHTTLDRLEAKGLVQFDIQEPEETGERRRKVFALKAEGRVALAQAYSTWTRMTRGLKPKLDSL